MTGVGGVEVIPSTAWPGQTVSVVAGPCSTPATAYSAAFGTTMARLRRHDHEMQGAVRISPHAAPGTYAVTVRCVEGGPYDGTFVVGDPVRCGRRSPTAADSRRSIPITLPGPSGSSDH